MTDTTVYILANHFFRKCSRSNAQVIAGKLSRVSLAAGRVEIHRSNPWEGTLNKEFQQTTLFFNQVMR